MTEEMNRERRAAPPASWGCLRWSGGYSWHVPIRTILPAALAIGVMLLVTFGILLPSFETAILGERKQALRELVVSARQIAVECHRLEEAGELSRDAAQRRALGMIRALRYGPEMKDYFWINDMHPRMVMHPHRPDLEGRDLSDFEDPNGTRLFVDAVDTVRRDGMGYIEYLWQWKDEPSRIDAKTSCVIGFEPWGWVIGTGMYVGDVLDEIAAATREAALVCALCTAIVAALALYMAVAMTRSENALRAERDRSARIVSGAPIIVFGAGADGSTRFVNPAGERTTGYPAEELVGGDWWHTLHPGEESARAEGLLRLLPEGDVLDYEMTLTTRSGEQRVISWNVIGQRDVSGDLIGAMGFGVDVTARKEGLRRISESEVRFRTLFESLPNVAVRGYDRDRRIIFWNDASEKLYGYSAEEAVGSRVEELILPPDSREDMVAAIDAWIADSAQGISAGEMSLVRKDGRRVPVYSSHVMLSDALGSIEIYCVDVDLSGLKETEKALVETSQRLAGIIGAMEGCISVLNPELAFVWANDVAKGLFGDDIVGRKCYSVYYGQDEACDACPVRQAFEDGQAHHYDAERVTAEGTSRSFSCVSNVAEFDADGRPALVVDVGHDVTERRRAEAERDRLESQLRQTQKMEAIGTLAGGIAHDFNNILFGAMGFTEMAVENVAEGSQAAVCLEQVSIAHQRAASLVRQILAFSRQTEDERQPMRVQPVVKEALNLLRSSLPSSVVMKIDIDPECGPVNADPTRVHQVVMNLCTNAAQAMREGGGTLRVSLDTVTLDGRQASACPGLGTGRHVRLTVSDTGHGMTEEIRKRLFEPYYTTKDVRDGTGLGLATVHGIVTDLGGGIQVDSQAGEGATFQVFLPVCGPDEPVERGRGDAELEGRERVLYVDDDEQAALFMKLSLEEMGYEVEVHTSGGDALELFGADPSRFDVVVTSQAMPNLTGIELIERLTRLRAGLPAVLCTGFSESPIRERARELGVSEFVTKPVLVREVARAVRRALDGSTAKEA